MTVVSNLAYSPNLVYYTLCECFINVHQDEVGGGGGSISVEKVLKRATWLIFFSCLFKSSLNL